MQPQKPIPISLLYITSIPSEIKTHSDESPLFKRELLNNSPFITIRIRNSILRYKYFHRVLNPPLIRTLNKLFNLKRALTEWPKISCCQLVHRMLSIIIPLYESSIHDNRRYYRRHIVIEDDFKLVLFYVLTCG